MFYLQNSLTKISIFQIIRKIQIKFWKVFLNFEVLHFYQFFDFQRFKLAKSLVASISLMSEQNFVENKLYLSSILRFIILKNFIVLHSYLFFFFWGGNTWYLVANLSTIFNFFVCYRFIIFWKLLKISFKWLQ